MKHFNIEDINSKDYWDFHQTAMDFGLRQEKYLELAGEGESIVELGCGLSPFLVGARHKFIFCYGVDYSPKTIETMKESYPDIRFYCEDCTKTGFIDKKFDVSVAGEVIEHFADPMPLINEMVRITKRRIIISTPHLEFVDPEHLVEYDEEDLHKLLSPFGNVTTETIKSDRFPGRSYIFATCDLL